MKALPLLLLTIAAAPAADCGLLPGAPIITVDHPNPFAHLPDCTVNGTLTTIALQAPTRFDWQTFQVNTDDLLVITSGNGTAHASFHNVTTATPAVINGSITADGAFTLQQATGGQIFVGQNGRITAPDITLTTQRAADALNYLRNGAGRFDAGSGSQPVLQVQGNLRSTNGDIKLIGSGLVQIGTHGKLEATGRKVSVFSGHNANVLSGSIAAAAPANGSNNIVQHFGIARGFRVEMRAVPDYDANLCPLGFCGGQPGLELGGEITATQVRLDTTHPFDSSVKNDTVGNLTRVSPNSGPNFQISTGAFQIQDFGGPVDDDPPVIPAPVKLPGLETAVPATSQPLAVTYSHLNSTRAGSRSAPLPAAGRALATRGSTAKTAKKSSARPVLRGSFFGVAVKAN